MIQISYSVIIRLNSEDADEKSCEYLLALFIVKSSCINMAIQSLKQFFSLWKKIDKSRLTEKCWHFSFEKKNVDKIDFNVLDTIGERKN